MHGSVRTKDSKTCLARDVFELCGREASIGQYNLDRREKFISKWRAHTSGEVVPVGRMAPFLTNNKE